MMRSVRSGLMRVEAYPSRTEPSRHATISCMSANEQPADEPRVVLARLRARLNRGGVSIARDLRSLFRGRKIDAAVLEELESRLLTADVGVEATNEILGDLNRRVARH